MLYILSGATEMVLGGADGGGGGKAAAKLSGPATGAGATGGLDCEWLAKLPHPAAPKQHSETSKALDSFMPGFLLRSLVKRMRLRIDAALASIDISLQDGKPEGNNFRGQLSLLTTRK
jgi:hypothetical protein